jgi:hypothetical protein
MTDHIILWCLSREKDSCGCASHPTVVVVPRIPQSEEIDRKIEEAGLEPSYDKQWASYRISLDKNSFDRHRALLTQLMRNAYDIRNG